MNKRVLSFLHPGAFRLFLAVTVLVSHSCRFDPGDWAVYTFFILSGYWISRMWENKYSRTDNPAVVFFISRLVRLLPVFLLANVVAAIVQRLVDPNFLGPNAQAWNWVPSLASNLLILGYSSLPHSQGALNVAWSLDVEMQFYIAFPVFVALLSRGRSAAFWTAFLGAACVAGLSIFLVQLYPSPRNLGCCGLYFFLGLMAARANWRPSEGTVSVVACAAVAFVAICWFVPEWRFLFENEKHGATALDYHHKRIAQAALAVFTAPVALFSVTQPSGARDRALGEFTYVMYLLHWPVIVLHSHYFAGLAPLTRVPSLLVAWLAIGALSLVVFRYLDQPIERVRKRWVSSRRAA